jgi:hypothetical protein
MTDIDRFQLSLFNMTNKRARASSILRRDMRHTVARLLSATVMPACSKSFMMIGK